MHMQRDYYESRVWFIISHAIFHSQIQCGDEQRAARLDHGAGLQSVDMSASSLSPEADRRPLLAHLGDPLFRLLHKHLGMRLQGVRQAQTVSAHAGGDA